MSLAKTRAGVLGSSIHGFSSDSFNSHITPEYQDEASDFVPTPGTPDLDSGRIESSSAIPGCKASGEAVSAQRILSQLEGDTRALPMCARDRLDQLAAQIAHLKGELAAMGVQS